MAWKSVPSEARTRKWKVPPDIVPVAQVTSKREVALPSTMVLAAEGCETFGTVAMLPSALTYFTRPSVESIWNCVHSPRYCVGALGRTRILLIAMWGKLRWVGGRVRRSLPGDPPETRLRCYATGRAGQDL